MSEAQSPPRKRKWRRRLAWAAGGAVVATGVYVALGPAAPGIIDSLADGRRVWRLGTIQIDGVTGTWLGDLHADHISIADDDGIWLEGDDLDLDWRPHDLLFGKVRLDATHVGSLSVLRRPNLLEPRPSSGASFDIRIDALGIERIDLAEPVLGEAATLRANLALNLRGDDLRLLDLDLRRLDSDADRAIVLYRPDGDYALNVDIEGAPGGVIARALNIAEQGVRATARGEGSTETGAAHYQASIGEAPLLSGEASWTADRWRFAADAQLTALPSLNALVKRLGENVALTAQGQRIGAFEAHAETPLLTLDLSGELNEARELVGSTQVAATTEQLSGIARESPFPLGAARFAGELRRARGATAIQGTLSADHVEALGRTVAMSGPVEAALSGHAFTLDGDLAAAPDAPALFANAHLRTQLEYNRERRRFELSRATLEGDAIALSAQGYAIGGGGEFSGEWRVRQLGALANDLTGEAGGRWRAFAQSNQQPRVWTIAVDGDGAGIGGDPNIVPQLLGATPDLDARLAYENGGLTVSHARINGARLRAAATGRIVGGQANLTLEASARGPLDIGGAQIEGALDATGRITGRAARPTLSANAVMSSFSAGGTVITQPHVRFTLAPSGRGYAGQAEVEGGFNGQPIAAASNVAIHDSVVALNELVAQVAALEARGSATVAPRGVTADVSLSGSFDNLAPGVSGRINGDLALTPETLALDAQIMDARAGDLRVRAATLRANGPLSNIVAQFTLRGRLNQAPLSFTGTANANLDDGRISIDGRGALADADVFTRAPMSANWGGGQLAASLNVGMGDGVVQAQWQERGRAVSGSAQIEDAPLGPLAAIWGERAVGRIDGRMNIASARGGLAGAADVTLDDARFAGRQRGTLDMHIVADLALQPAHCECRCQFERRAGGALRSGGARRHRQRSNPHRAAAGTARPRDMVRAWAGGEPVGGGAAAGSIALRPARRRRRAAIRRRLSVRQWRHRNHRRPLRR
ncbi:MAG: hypothetical protein R3C16_13020 [Hyphomonadaceae bacterium]